MEKKPLLDPRHSTVILIILTLFVTSCSLPRILVIHDPLSAEEHINLGVAYEKKGELDAAMKEYTAASKTLPIAFLYMGNIYFTQKEYQKAEKAYWKAIRKLDSPEAYNNLAWLLYITDSKLDKAEKLAAKAVELSPQSDDFKDTLEKIREKRASK
jgi:tetratricopeptide (TPR) repeat protein